MTTNEEITDKEILKCKFYEGMGLGVIIGILIGVAISSIIIHSIN